MAGVFDIDLDQPEENVSDDELEEVTAGFEVNGTRECLPPRAVCAGLRPEEYASGCFMLC